MFENHLMSLGQPKLHWKFCNFWIKTRFKKIHDRELCTSLYFFCMSLHVIYFCMTLHVITRHIFCMMLHVITCHIFLHVIAYHCMFWVPYFLSRHPVFAFHCKSWYDIVNFFILHYCKWLHVNSLCKWLQVNSLCMFLQVIASQHSFACLCM